MILFAPAQLVGLAVGVEDRRSAVLDRVVPQVNVVAQWFSRLAVVGGELSAPRPAVWFCVSSPPKTKPFSGSVPTLYQVGLKPLFT